MTTIYLKIIGDRGKFPQFMYTYILYYVALMKALLYTDPHEINFSRKENLYDSHALTAIIQAPTQSL